MTPTCPGAIKEQWQSHPKAGDITRALDKHQLTIYQLTPEQCCPCHQGCLAGEATGTGEKDLSEVAQPGKRRVQEFTASPLGFYRLCWKRVGNFGIYCHCFVPLVSREIKSLLLCLLFVLSGSFFGPFPLNVLENGPNPLGKQDAN